MTKRLYRISVDRGVGKVGDPVEARRMPRIGLDEVSNVSERHAARRICPGVGRAGTTMAKGLRCGDRAEPADAVAVAADMRPEPAMHRDTGHRVVAALPGMAAADIADEPRRQQPDIAEAAASEQHLI